MSTMDYVPLGISRFETKKRRHRGPKGPMKGWVFWTLVIIATPFVAMAAYQPAALLAINNLSDLASAVTARSNLGLGNAAVKGVSDNTKTNVASISGATTSGHIATFADTAGTVQDGGTLPTGTVSSVTCGTGLTGGTFTTTGTCALAANAVTVYTGTSPLTLGAAIEDYEDIEMGTPAALTINLPATPTDGTHKCIKDGLKNFNTDNATIKTTDSGTIDKSSGSTGFVMNQNGQQTCFRYVASKTNWIIE